MIIQVEKENKFFPIAEKNHQWEFLLLTKFSLEDPHYSNLKILWEDSLKPEQLYKLYSSADYVLVDVDKPQIWLPAMFCGATPIHEIEQLEKAVKNTSPLSLVERIENWEKAESILTLLTTSGIKEL